VPQAARAVTVRRGPYDRRVPDPTSKRAWMRRLLQRAFPRAQWPWWRDPRFRRHAGPDLLSALACAVLLLPPFAFSSFAHGMSQAVAVQCLFAFIDMPILYVLAFLSPPRVPRWLAVGALLLVYGAQAAVFSWYAWKGSGLDAGFVLVFLLPVALRALALARAIDDGETATTMAVLSLGTIMPWMLTMVLIAVPLGTFAGLERANPGTDVVTLLPPAWNAMGVAYFTLVALMRWFVGLQTANQRAGTA
jgi:hypothetical protein